MAYEIPGFAFTLPAGQDLRTNLYCFIDLNGAGACVLPSAGERAIAVIQTEANTGEGVGLMQTGISKCIAGVGGVGSGDDVSVDANGHVVAPGSGDFIVGTCLEGGAEDSVVPVLLRSGSGAGS